MFSIKITVVCDTCRNLLPGVGENWWECTFNNMDSALHQGRKLGWILGDKIDANGNHISTAMCPTCKGK